MGITLRRHDKFRQKALEYGLTMFGLPRTGQIISYRDGDDGFYQYGSPSKGLRYKDNGDGTVTDLATGIMWKKECWKGQMIWTSALKECNDLVFAGYDDWYMPNVFELLSIIDFSQKPANPNPDIFELYTAVLLYSSTYCGQFEGSVPSWNVSYGYMTWPWIMAWGITIPCRRPSTWHHIKGRHLG